MEELGLSDRLLQLPHAKMRQISIQTFIQKRLFAPILTSNRTFVPPAFLRLPILRDLPARLIALGVFPVHVKT